MDKIKSFILSQLVEKQIDRSRAKELLLELESRQGVGDIAIIGMAGRFSAADDIDAFWEYLKQGRSTIRDYPSLRKDDMNAILRNPHHAELLLGSPVIDGDFDGLYAMSGYLNRIDTFDAHLFGIPPTEAEYMDPHQRVALEIAHETFENAGYGGDAAKGSRTGVFLGRDQTNMSYYKMFSERHPLQLSGSWEGLVASRISYLYDLKGPCLMTDTACSAGAVSIHQAVQSLTLGECDMALAGGINLTTGEVKPDYAAGAAMGSVTSGHNTIRTFDARADGTLWGEGVGLVLLKPLAAAQRDGDNIRAIIRASAINNDGTSSSITAPSAPMQEKVILDAWSQTDFSPETITYVEAHGTGTVLGDPIELKGLTGAFRQHTSRRQFCGIGSLKTTMGHLVAASGIASVAKVVKSLETGLLAPTGNFGVPNPYVDFTHGPLYVTDRLTPWERGAEPRRAGISSFGFIRTNCHLVLEEGPAYQPAPAGRSHHLFTLSARTEEALDILADRYATALAASPATLADICYTTHVGRGHHEHRLAIVATSKGELLDLLALARNGGLRSRPGAGVFVAEHHVVSDRQVDLAPGDINTAARKELSGAAVAALRDHLERGDAESLGRVAALYTRGAQLDFAPLHSEAGRRRVLLPSYPYAQTRYWAPVLQSKVASAPLARQHPLLGAQVERGATAITFENTLAVGTHWVLADHRINQHAVLPGTAYLEMARAAFEAVEGPGQVHLSETLFMVPLVVPDDEVVRVRTRLTTDAVGGYRFDVASERDGTWTTHVEGRVVRGTRPSATCDVQSIRDRATATVEPDLTSDDTGVFRFGPHWHSIRRIQTGPDAVAVEIALPPGIDSETATLGLHPAKLDNAVNAVSQEHGGTFLPYAYQDFVLHAPMPACFDVVIRTVGVTTGETITYDIDLVDATGSVFAEIRKYTTKRVDWSRLTLDEVRRQLEIAWVPAPGKVDTVSADAHLGLIIRATPAGDALVAALRDSGREVTPFRLAADPGPDEYAPDEAGMAELCARLAAEEVDRIVVATDVTCDLDDTPRDRSVYGAGALFELTRALLAQRVKPQDGLAVLGRAAWQIGSAPTPVDPYSAATESLAVVVGQENPHLRVEVVDVGPDAAASDTASACLARYGTAIRGVRGGSSFVRQLGSAVVMDDQTVEGVYRDGSFLVTGGAGGLGLGVAEDMLRKGARRVLLCSRRSLDADTGARVAALGSAVEYVQCDVTNPQDVKGLGQHLIDRRIVLDGIVHAAGLAGDGFLATKERATFEAVLQPKMAGAEAMLHLARQHRGAFLVLFSSITALTGGQGQGDYCAANAFMDALAVQARSTGVRAHAINWPAWAEIGMAVDYGVDEQTVPFRSIPVRAALDWLEGVVGGVAPGGIPAEVNPAGLREVLGELPFLLEPRLAASVQGEPDAEPVESSVEVRLTGLAQPTATQVRVGEVYAAVLGLPEIDVFATFQDLGGNSLMTAQLLKRLDAIYPGVVDIADLFSYVTVESLAGFVEQQTGSDVAGADAPAVAGSLGDELRDVLAEFGDSDLSAVFEEAGRR